MRIAFTTRLTEELEQQLMNKFPELSFSFFASIDRVNELERIDVLVTYGEDLTEEIMEQAKTVSWIMVLSAGVDEMPLRWLEEHNIQVTNARGIHKHPMSEYAMAMLLGHYREIFTFYEQQKEKKWHQDIKTKEINHRKMTIIGAGAIGEELARLAQAFHIETTAVTISGGERKFFDKSFTLDQIDEAIVDRDFIISILPSTEVTRPFYKLEHFQKMNPSTVFLNMGRGDVVETDTLIQALDQNEISHAILDVAPTEPLDESHPFWVHDNITLTPHISGKSSQYLPRAINIFEENLSSYLKGEPLPKNKVDLKRGY